MLDSILKRKENRNHLNILWTYLFNYTFFKKCKRKNNELLLSYTQKSLGNEIHHTCQISQFQWETPEQINISGTEILLNEMKLSKFQLTITLKQDTFN